jgi:hypothetical protein
LTSGATGFFAQAKGTNSSSESLSGTTVVGGGGPSGTLPSGTLAATKTTGLEALLLLWLFLACHFVELILFAAFFVQAKAMLTSGGCSSIFFWIVASSRGCPLEDMRILYPQLA